MIDAWIMPLQRCALAGPAWVLVKLGVTADKITMAGFALGVLCLPALAFHANITALVLLLLNRFADGLDGAVARQTGPTDRGAFLDIALDFLFYALFPLGFACADPSKNALPAAVLIASFVGTGSSFLAFASIAAKRGMTTESFPHKGIYYLGGLTEGAETIGLFALFCLFPWAFPVLAYIFSTACLLTTALRWRQGWLAFSVNP
jgi:phosphatidylglycerophosphate synthase